MKKIFFTLFFLIFFLTACAHNISLSEKKLGEFVFGLDDVADNQACQKARSIVEACKLAYQGEAYYLIVNIHQLQSIDSKEGESTADSGKNYILGGDIDASETMNWNQGKGFDPIGYETKKDAFGLAGKFYGQNYSIRNLFINRPSKSGIGLFSFVNSNGGMIDSLQLKEVRIKGKNVVGGLVALNAGTVQNSYAAGSVEGKEGIGGLIGLNAGTVQNSYTTGSIEGNSQVGGLVGANIGTVQNSYATGTVEGKEGVGGLIGANIGTVQNSHTTGSIERNDFIGELVGNAGTVQNSYATGSVSGNTRIGGLVGINTDTVQNSYATGSVSGNDYVGGLIGSHTQWTDEQGNEYIGKVQSSFWDTRASTQNQGIGPEASKHKNGIGEPVGLTSSKMKARSGGIIGLGAAFDYGSSSQYPAVYKLDQDGRLSNELVPGQR